VRTHNALCALNHELDRATVGPVQPPSRALVYAGLGIFGLLILIFGDWISALVYALVVVIAALAAWLLGRWNWIENRRLRREIDKTTVASYERRAGSGEMPRIDHRGQGAPPGGLSGGGGDPGGGAS
jgi:uncharacterized membrane protein YgcG